MIAAAPDDDRDHRLEIRDQFYGGSERLQVTAERAAFFAATSQPVPMGEAIIDTRLDGRHQLACSCGNTSAWVMTLRFLPKFCSRCGAIPTFVTGGAR